MHRITEASQYNKVLFSGLIAMIKFLVFVALLGLAWSAPAPGPNPAPAPAPNPAPAPKPLFISEIKTPASTAKLTPIIAPLSAPLISPTSRIALFPHYGPYVSYPYGAPLAPLEIAAAPATYSIEQHGYNIAY